MPCRYLEASDDVDRGSVFQLLSELGSSKLRQEVKSGEKEFERARALGGTCEFL